MTMKEKEKFITGTEYGYNSWKIAVMYDVYRHYKNCPHCGAESFKDECGNIGIPFDLITEKSAIICIECKKTVMTFEELQNFWKKLLTNKKLRKEYHYGKVYHNE